jgi:hypothetical protein
MRFSLLASSRSSTACLAPNIKTQSPLRERKEQLRQPLSRTGSPLQFSDHQIGRGSGVLRRGLVSCRWRASSPSAWMRPTRPAIAAFRSTSDARTGGKSWWSAGPIPEVRVCNRGLLLAYCDLDGRRVYAGRVGLGLFMRSSIGSGTAWNRSEPPATACNRLQPPATACIF